MAETANRRQDIGFDGREPFENLGVCALGELFDLATEGDLVVGLALVDRRLVRPIAARTPPLCRSMLRYATYLHLTPRFFDGLPEASNLGIENRVNRGRR